MAEQIFEESREMMDIVLKLKEERFDLFGSLFSTVQESMIACAVRVDKAASSSCNEVLKIKGVKGPLTVISNGKRYLLYGYKTKWDDCSPNQKIAWIANMLCRIDFPTEEEIRDLMEKNEDFEFGKIKKPDVNDFRLFLKNESLGLDWADKDDIGNLIEDKNIQN